MAGLFIQPLFTLAEAERTLAALEASQEHAIAKKLRRAIDTDRSLYEAHEAAAKADEERRLSRAANHTLTKRQAECLAAIRAGKSPSEQPYYWTDQAGVRQWRWRYCRSMGGAVNRMIETLIEEGMLSKRDKLTEPGLARLEAWEAKHGRIGPEATEGR